VFFSGGPWRSGGTTQFLPQAEYFVRQGMAMIRAEYRDSRRDKVNPDTCLKDAVSAMRWGRKALIVSSPTVVAASLASGSQCPQTGGLHWW
jgi:hypothetical protein